MKRRSLCFFWSLVAATQITLAEAKLSQDSPEAAQSTGLEQKVERLERDLRELRQLVDQLRCAPNTSNETVQEASSQPVTVPAVARSAADTKDPQTFRTYWRSGLRADSANRDFRLNFGLQMQNDWATFFGAEGLENQTGSSFNGGTEFRRARVHMAGSLYQRVDFKTQYDLADGVASFKDVYVGLNTPALGTVRVGHQKHPFGLEALTSSRFTTFMERSLASVLYPGRDTGMRFDRRFLDQRLTFGAGIFKDSDSFGNSQASNFSFASRLTGLPWIRQQGNGLLHLGVSYSRRSHAANQVRFAQRPESHLAPRLVDTGLFHANRTHVLGLEGSWVNGPFSIQGEFFRAFVDSNQRDPRFASFYVEGSFFLTGESRGYSKSKGAFDRFFPARNLRAGERGAGAWELSGRFSRLDLRDGPVDGGQLQNFTVGLNWYLNPYTKMMLNYVRSDVDQQQFFDSLLSNILQMRFQVDF